MSQSPPTTLGKYQIIREIARSNDIVYEAYDPLMNRRVALKELSMPGGSTPQQKEDRISRFKREAQAAGTLNHPNIMTVYELGQEGDRFFMAMEFLDGHTLRNELDTKGFLPLEKSVEIALEILNGLDHAHQKGVVHRDIKPDNIQLLSSGEVKITDFGIARLTFQPNLTLDGQVFGTPSYMSPEQVVGREIDARSDLFSLAVVLYEMLSGQKPFQGDSVVSITYSIMNKSPDPIASCPFPLWQLLERALDKSAQMRPSSASEMSKTLQAVVRQIQGGTVLDPILPNQPTVTGGQQPYNPYSTSQPGITTTPYGAPMPTTPAPPPVMYPYNPYANPAGGAAPPHSPQYQPIPIFYPPPPRQPMLKPETRAFLGKLLLTTVLLGTLFALVIVGLNAGVQAWQRYQQEQVDRQRIGQIRNVPISASLEDQIQHHEEVRDAVTSEVTREDENRKVANLKVRQAQDLMANGQLLEAEALLKEALVLDPGNGEPHALLGELYHRLSIVAEQSSRLDLIKQSTDSLVLATQGRLSSETRLLIRGRAAESALGYAQVLLAQRGQIDRSQARNYLYSARELAEVGSSTFATADSLLRSLTGS